MKPNATRLSTSLEALKALLDENRTAIKSSALARADRERLTKHGFLKEVMRGWYIVTNPSEDIGNSTSWYSSFWGFCGDYLTDRLGHNWCLYPEQSLLIHVGDRTVPAQLLVRSPTGRNQPTDLIHNTSIFDTRLDLPDRRYIETIDGLNTLSLSYALVQSSPKLFLDNAIVMRTALAMVSDSSDLLEILIAGNHSEIAGRLAGGFRNIGRDFIANNILNGMKAADFVVNEKDPFTAAPLISFHRREISPYVNRLRLMWADMRQIVIDNFPMAPRSSVDVSAYLEQVDDNYLNDAYHSLSIEGYRVSHELIELIRSGNWNPLGSDETQKHLDAMAAKGYWETFLEVKKAVHRILKGENAGYVLEEVHADWYLALFRPSVTAGIIKQVDLAGYRNGPVFITQSKHTPPSRDALRDMMPTFFDLISAEESAPVRVVLGHFFFVYIHPYFDGNGRMGRFIMNLMMASGGFPWTVVPVERREEYMSALERASVHGDITPFSKFIASLLSH